MIQKNPIATELHQRCETDAGIEEFNEFMQPENFVKFIRNCAWDFPTFTEWMMQVAILAGQQSKEFDT